jgi:hypothetical protein
VYQYGIPKNCQFSCIKSRSGALILLFSVYLNIRIVLGHKLSQNTIIKRTVSLKNVLKPVEMLKIRPIFQKKSHQGPPKIFFCKKGYHHWKAFKILSKKHVQYINYMLNNASFFPNRTNQSF